VDVSGQIHDHILLFFTDLVIPRNITNVTSQFILASLSHSGNFVYVLFLGLFFLLDDGRRGIAFDYLL